MVEALGLPRLGFLSGEALRLVLADAWSHMSCLFAHEERYYLVDWATSA